MNVVLTGGGTGGHVYPALSVAAALRREAPETSLLYLGLAGGAEQRLVLEHGIPFIGVHSGQLRGKSPLRVAGSLARLAWGVLEARGALTGFRAQRVFATGGYASMPVVLATARSRIPLTVFLPDVYPGWAVRTAARLATSVATTCDGALEHLPHEKTVVTGYPLREEFWQADRTSARAMLGLGDGPVLLVSGASSGSRILNDAILASLDLLLPYCEVVHLTGLADEVRVRAAREALPAALQRRYQVYGYLEQMASAMAAADLAVMRAGASCLAEPPAVGLPAILVPGSFSDQRRNAEYMAARGAAILLDEGALDSLSERVLALFAAPDRLHAMAAAARALARPNAARELANLLLYGRAAPQPWEVEAG
jgi:UDP-N-acetylglucosamine--N-acetylmuramyl-(pentapeptide) pyrophosphoryl-undecaprenol N-acetylglucosamine transferase